MHYVVETDKSVSAAADALEKAVVANGFGVLHVYDLKQTLAGKGVTLPHECRIYEVCNPHQANKVLTADMRLSVALPCRIAVYEERGRTKIGTLRPTQLLAEISDDAGLGTVAESVERSIETIIHEAAA